MPCGWVHETLDLIVFGTTYRAVHQAKDAHSQLLPGIAHRRVGHEWYQAYGAAWTFAHPFPNSANEEISTIRRRRGPDAAEEQMASVAHDNFDRHWDELSALVREFWEGFFVWLLYRPDLLESWAGVDVLRGRILRTINDEQVWEESAAVCAKYRELRRRVSRNYKHRLRSVLVRYG